MFVDHFLKIEWPYLWYLSLKCLKAYVKCPFWFFGGGGLGVGVFFVFYNFSYIAKK